MKRRWPLISISLSVFCLSIIDYLSNKCRDIFFAELYRLVVLFICVESMIQRFVFTFLYELFSLTTNHREHTWSYCARPRTRNNNFQPTAIFIIFLLTYKKKMWQMLDYRCYRQQQGFILSLSLWGFWFSSFAISALLLYRGFTSCCCFDDIGVIIIITIIL